VRDKKRPISNVTASSSASAHALKPVLNGDGKPIRIGELQYVFHRLGGVISLFGVIQYLDPYNMHDAMPREIGMFLIQNRSNIMLLAAAFSFCLPIELLYRISLHRDAPLTYRYSMIGVVLLQTALSNSLNFYMFSSQRYLWAAAITLLGYSICNFTLLVVLHIAMWSFRRQISKLRNTARRTVTGDRSSASASAARPGSNSSAEDDVHLQPQQVVSGDDAAAQMAQRAQDQDSEEDTANHSGDGTVMVQLTPDTAAQARMDPAGTSQAALTPADPINAPVLPPYGQVEESVSKINVASSTSSSSSSKPLAVKQHKPSTVSTGWFKSSTTRARGQTSALSETIRKPLRNMTIYQVMVTIVSGSAVLICLLGAIDGFSRPYAVETNADLTRFKFGSDLGVTIVHLAGVSLGLWYSYVPVSVLWRYAHMLLWWRTV